MHYFMSVYRTAQTTMNEFERRLDRFFERLFDDMPTARVYAIHMIAVGLSNMFNDAGNVNRALIQVWGIPASIVHVYMFAIVVTSVGILAHRAPPWWWFLMGISYVVLILTSVIALAIVNPTQATLSTALRVFALNGLLFFLLIKNLRGRV